MALSFAPKKDSIRVALLSFCTVPKPNSPKNGNILTGKRALRAFSG
jgi:hypothetical protein